LLTDAQGTYTFGGLAPGTYVVREVLQTTPPPPWIQTTPASGSFTVTIVDATTTAAGNDFGNFRLVAVSGTVFNDVNYNGTRDPGEPALAGWTVYDDLNNNGILDPGEPSTLSSATGAYNLTNIGPGTHYIREVLQTGWYQTAPGAATAGAHVITTASGQNVTGRDFRNRLINPASIARQAVHDLHANGANDPREPRLAG